MSVFNPGLPYGAGSTPPATRNADADADFAAALVGEIVNARVSVLRRSTGDFTRPNADAGDVVNGLAVSSIMGQYVHALMVGLDGTSAARLIRAGTGATASWGTALYGALVNSRPAVYRPATSDFSELTGDSPAQAEGDAHDAFLGLYTNAAEYYKDSDQATPVFRFREMNRAIRTSTVNPADGATLATLDCRGLTNKSLIIDSTVADDAHIEFSPEGTNWHRLATVAYGVGVTVMLTAVQFEALRGFRYVRMIQNGAAVGTVIGLISAQGA